MAGMCYYGNVMTTTRCWISVTMATLWQKQDGGYVTMATLRQQQDGGNKFSLWLSMTVYDCTVEDVEYIYNKFSLWL